MFLILDILDKTNGKICRWYKLVIFSSALNINESKMDYAKNGQFYNCYAK